MEKTATGIYAFSRLREKGFTYITKGASYVAET